MKPGLPAFSFEYLTGGSMKHLSLQLLAETIVNKRKTLKMSDNDLSDKTGISLSTLPQLESGEYPLHIQD